MLAEAYSYLGVAGSITTVLGLMALIVLAAYGAATSAINRRQDTLKQAVESGNTAIVDAMLTRFGIDNTKLTGAQALQLATEQIRSQKTTEIIKYSLIFSAFVVFLILIAALFMPRGQDQAELDLKLVIALSAVPKASRIAAYEKFCACSTPPPIREVLLAMEEPSAGPSGGVVPQSVVTGIEQAKSRSDVEAALVDLKAQACDGDYRFRVVDGVLQCRDGKPLPFVTIAAQGQPLKEFRAIVMHSTGQTGVQGVINWFRNDEAKASAHLIVSRTGLVVQLVNFQDSAWHAGRSQWNGLQGLNAYSVGIEFENVGKLTGNKSWMGQTVPESEVYVDGAGQRWQDYSRDQIAIAEGVTGALYEAYGKVPILGHSDIAPGRKEDPGPAFPMETVRRQVDAPSV